MRRLCLTFLLTLAVTTLLQAQEPVAFDTVRVCTYRIDRFDSASHDRVGDLRTIFDAIEPQVLCIQDFTSYNAVRLFRDSIMEMMDRPLLGNAFFITPPDHLQESFSVIFYDRSIFQGEHNLLAFDSTHALLTLRLYHTGGDSMLVMTTEWKSGSTSDDAARRVSSADVVHKTLSTFIPEQWGTIENVLLAGALNLHGSDEPAYQALVGPDSGIFVDPIDRPGAWHGNAAFADIHTSDARSGLIDRFDQILLTPALMPRYLPGSYTVFGNDGAHFGDSVAALPNESVSPELARTLQDASAHLPVYVDLLFERPSSDVPEPSSMRELDLTERGRR